MKLQEIVVEIESATMEALDSIAKAPDSDLSAILAAAEITYADLRAELKKSPQQWVELFPELHLLGYSDFRGMKLSGAFLSGANLSGADLSGADLSGADLSGADLSMAFLNEANLSGADLSGVDLSRAFLSGANLSGANLSGADLSRAFLSTADLSGADLGRARLVSVRLSYADLHGANLRGADLRGSQMFHVNLSEANLSGAHLGPHRSKLWRRGQRADLSWANLIRANLTGADLTRADLTEANVTGAKQTTELREANPWRKTRGRYAGVLGIALSTALFVFLAAHSWRGYGWLPAIFATFAYNLSKFAVSVILRSRDCRSHPGNYFFLKLLRWGVYTTILIGFVWQTRLFPYIWHVIKWLWNFKFF